MDGGSISLQGADLAGATLLSSSQALERLIPRATTRSNDGETLALIPTGR